MIKSFFLFLLLFGLSAQALVGLENLTTKLSDKNLELAALKQQVESKEALYFASRSNYFPTLNAIGGWAEYKADDLPSIEKGYVGYIEGRYNLFNGLKDRSVAYQREIDLKLSRVELESKQRQLRTELTEVASDMILLHKLQEILDEEDNITKIQTQMASKKVSAGLTGSVDSLEFSLRESEIQIEKSQIDQLHLEAHQKLNKLYGEELSHAEFDKISFSEVDTLVNSTKMLSLENNLDYQKSDLLLSKAQYEKSEFKADFFPKLDFIFDVGRLTPNENTPVQFNESKYALILTIPLFSGLETFNKTKSANFQITSAEKNKDQKIIDLQADIIILKKKAAELSQLYKINEFRLVNSQKYFDLTLAEYRRGIKNSPDLVTATDRLFSSKKRKYEILKELELLKLKIDNI